MKSIGIILAMVIVFIILMVGIEDTILRGIVSAIGSLILGLIVSIFTYEYARNGVFRLKVVHQLDDTTVKVIIEEKDEEGILTRTKYEADSAWISGYKKIII